MKHGVPFSLVLEDIKVPEVCPILGIPLCPGVGRHGPGSPSIDRIVPSLGYVPENILVVSHRANQIKSNATPSELVAVALFHLKEKHHEAKEYNARTEDV